MVVGPVSFRPATLDDWGDAVPNYPLTSGDSLWTDRAARAEVQLGQAAARLGADTSFGVLNLDDRFGAVPRHPGIGCADGRRHVR